jgi:hypothetical protein
MAWNWGKIEWHSKEELSQLGFEFARRLSFTISLLKKSLVLFSVFYRAPLTVAAAADDQNPQLFHFLWNIWSTPVIYWKTRFVHLTHRGRQSGLSVKKFTSRERSFRPFIHSIQTDFSHEPDRYTTSFRPYDFLPLLIELCTEFRGETPHNG